MKGLFQKSESPQYFLNITSGFYKDKIKERDTLIFLIFRSTTISNSGF